MKYSRLEELVSTSAFPWKEIVIIVFSMGRWWRSSVNFPLVRRDNKSSYTRSATQAFVYTSRRFWSQHHFPLNQTLIIIITIILTRNCKPICRTTDQRHAHRTKLEIVMTWNSCLPDMRGRNVRETMKATVTATLKPCGYFDLDEATMFN